VTCARACRLTLPTRLPHSLHHRQRRCVPACRSVSVVILCCRQCAQTTQHSRCSVCACVLPAPTALPRVRASTRAHCAQSWLHCELTPSACAQCTRAYEVAGGVVIAHVFAVRSSIYLLWLYNMAAITATTAASVTTVRAPALVALASTTGCDVEASVNARDAREKRESAPVPRGTTTT
jgi:hypothetical protein